MGNTTYQNWQQLFFKNIYIPYTCERYVTDLNEFDINRNEYQIPQKEEYYLITFAANKHQLDNSLDLAFNNLQKYYRKGGLILLAPNDDCSSIQCESFQYIQQKVNEKFREYSQNTKLFVKQDIQKPHSHLLRYFFFKAKDFPNQPNTMYVLNYTDQVDKNKKRVEECKRLYQLN